jgi:hypothetical protein
MSSLPCGVTDAMCCPRDDPCGSCGHLFSDHYSEEGDFEIEDDILSRDSSSYSSSIVYDAEGYVVSACDIVYCDGCEGYSDDEYEPEYYEEDR